MIKTKNSLRRQLLVNGLSISMFNNQRGDLISLTDIARYKDRERTNYIIQNWMRNRGTIEFLGLWEQINNPDFKGIEFDAFKHMSGSNTFSLTPKRWVELTHAIGILIQIGRYGGGVFANSDIAF